MEYRRELTEGGIEAIKESKDPMIQFFKILEKEYRARRKQKEALEEVERQAYAKIEDARVAVERTSSYPDATFTLRLSFGVVKGYEEDGREVPPWTTFGGAFAHQAAHEAKEPWKLPASWNEAKDRIGLKTPLNFVSTADIIGGNSGSPVVNRAGEFVGIIFDGNIQSLTADYLYDDAVSRAVSVHSSGSAKRGGVSITQKIWRTNWGSDAKRSYGGLQSPGFLLGRCVDDRFRRHRLRLRF